MNVANKIKLTMKKRREHCTHLVKRQRSSKFKKNITKWIKGQ